MYDVTYNLTLWSLREMAKKKSSQEPTSAYIKLKSTMEWVDAQAQIKVEIVKALFPNKATVNNSQYSVFFSIPRHVKNLKLVSEEDYAHMLSITEKVKNNPTVNLVVKEVRGGSVPSQRCIYACLLPKIGCRGQGK